jgi:hypothetical protein
MSGEAANAVSRRDQHVRRIAARGRMAWQRETHHGRRSLVETAIRR